MILVIDCCPSGENSATRKFYESYLNTLENKDDIKVVYLEEENLSPYTKEDVLLREKNLAENNMNWEGFKYANDFSNADEIIIAAPYWDLSFPSLLKVYIEHIMIPGITFGYEGTQAVGYSKANNLKYFTTVGGFINDKNYGSDYIESISEMLGIPEFESYAIEGLDIDPLKREELIEKGINQVLKEI